MSEKFDQFTAEIRELFAALDVPCDEATINSYWRVLHECRVSDVRVRIDQFLGELEPGQKRRPPRPWELRPERVVPVTPETGDPKLRPAILRAIQRMDDLYLRDPVEWAIEWNIQLCSRKVETIPVTDPSWPQWSEELREWHRISRGQQKDGKMSEDPRALKEAAVPTYAEQATWPPGRRQQELNRMKTARLQRGCPA